MRFAKIMHKLLASTWRRLADFLLIMRQCAPVAIATSTAATDRAKIMEIFRTSQQLWHLALYKELAKHRSNTNNNKKNPIAANDINHFFPALSPSFFLLCLFALKSVLQIVKTSTRSVAVIAIVVGGSV